MKVIGFRARIQKAITSEGQETLQATYVHFKEVVFHMLLAVCPYFLLGHMVRTKNSYNSCFFGVDLVWNNIVFAIGLTM